MYNVYTSQRRIERPAISIVMSVYNGERFLRASIQSILGQTFKCFEIVVVDDGSSDQSNGILRSMIDDGLVDTLVVNSRNIGLTKSLNLGVKYARSSLIARQDVDDLSLPRRFEEQVAFIKDYDLIGGLTVTLYQDGTQRSYVPTSNPIKKIFLTSPFAHSTAMFRKEVFLKVGAYNESFPVSQDFELWMRFAEHGRVGILNRPVIERLVHDGMISRNKGFSQLLYSHRARVMHLHGSYFIAYIYSCKQVVVLLVPRIVKEWLKIVRRVKR